MLDFFNPSILIIFQKPVVKAELLLVIGLVGNFMAVWWRYRKLSGMAGCDGLLGLLSMFLAYISHK